MLYSIEYENKGHKIVERFTPVTKLYFIFINILIQLHEFNEH